MPVARNTERSYFIDYLRGLLVFYVVLDHSMHAYSPLFKKFHFFQVFGGSPLFDVWHMHNDVIMMPLLYFLAGMFVLPSLARRGLLSFAKEKFYRLVLPLLFGIAVIVPPQMYIKNLVKNNLDQGYFDYWFNSYFVNGDIGISAFWFIYYLAILTALLVLINWVAPWFMRLMGRFATWLVENPIKGFVTFCLIGATVIAASEVNWSTQHWTEFWYLFWVRSSRFIMKAFLFFLGAGVAHAGILQNKELLTRLGSAWKTWVAIALMTGTAYISYAITNFHTGAYTTEILRHFHFGGTWFDLYPVMKAYGIPLLIRASLLGIFMCSLIVMYLSVFKRFLDEPRPYWQSLAACSFGIYIFHEPLVHVVQYYFLESDTSDYIKFIAAAGFATAVSWGLTNIIKGWPGIKKIL